ncbi:MAG TPA: enoyl-CoA hydratase/isomerase family protein [Pyrinomonadaceae bacterium]|nr:enoyl-CoA hydratase/isomerase family protein [Pyrinomonadaceae bacterium]
MSGDERRGPPVVVEPHGAAAVIRLARPDERNPLSTSTLNAIEEAFSQLSADASINSVVFNGTGDVFASGADIREVSSLTPDSARSLSARGQRLFQTIADARTLTIAAVDGYCMGGGLDLALACRLRVASPRAVFAHPGARLGIITGWGGTRRLPLAVGPSVAAEMFLTGRRLNGAEAYESGLVEYLSERPLERALEIALASSV